MFLNFLIYRKHNEFYYKIYFYIVYKILKKLNLLIK